MPRSTLSSSCEAARQATADETAGMEWFNALTDAGRAYWLDCAGSGVPADAWEAFKREGAQVITVTRPWRAS